eukprot:1342303-Amorphochlora_amoeboformis.AAC.2
MKGQDKIPKVRISHMVYGYYLRYIEWYINRPERTIICTYAPVARFPTSNRSAGSRERFSTRGTPIQTRCRSLIHHQVGIDANLSKEILYGRRHVPTFRLGAIVNQLLQVFERLGKYLMFKMIARDFRISKLSPRGDEDVSAWTTLSWLEYGLLMRDMSLWCPRNVLQP